VLNHLKTVKPLNYLLIGLPFAVLGTLLNWNASFNFVAACIGLVPLASLIGEATEANSLGVAGVMIVLYSLGLIFSLRASASALTQTTPSEAPRWSIRNSALVLALSPCSRVSFCPCSTATDVLDLPYMARR